MSANKPRRQHGFFETLSRNLKREIPDARGFSPHNLRYMECFYELFPEDGAECGGGVILPQVAAELFSVPWSHIRTIIDKCRGNREKAEFYIHKTVENVWSRAVLLNFFDGGLYERQGKVVNSFSSAYPAP